MTSDAVFGEKRLDLRHIAGMVERLGCAGRGTDIGAPRDQGRNTRKGSDDGQCSNHPFDSDHMPTPLTYSGDARITANLNSIDATRPIA
jgi:hypothetical protein